MIACPVRTGITWVESTNLQGLFIQESRRVGLIVFNNDVQFTSTGCDPFNPGESCYCRVLTTNSTKAYKITRFDIDVEVHLKAWKVAFAYKLTYNAHLNK